jgi:hypothetical protein
MTPKNGPTRLPCNAFGMPERVADQVAAFRIVDGGLGGWDGWVRGRFNKRIVGIIWPEE